MNLSANTHFHAIEESDRFLALFPHRHDYIWAEHPKPGEKPNWQTESRHLLSDRLVLQGSYLYGVRFGRTTDYLLLDIDRNSSYHPQRDSFAISRLVDALEPLGITNYLAVTSSHSGGIHLYVPFEQPQKSHELAQAAGALLENGGFVLAQGQLEVFPNDRGFVDNRPTLYAAHRLPLQLGSYLLNQEWEPVFTTQIAFVHQWQFCQRQNSVTIKIVRHILKTAKRKHLVRSGKANKFLNDLHAEIEPGWSGSGQTNRILGRIALRTYIFGKVLYGFYLEGKALVDKIVEVAKALPGYQDYCGHQHEIEHRAEEWAQCVENSPRYYPYKQKNKSKPAHVLEQAQTEIPSWHERKQEDARSRIKGAIAQLLESGSIPAGATARYKALLQHGIGGETLYKHKDLWHPEFLLPEPEDSELLEPVDNPPDPPNCPARRTEDAPERPSLLDSNFSDTPLGKLLNGFEPCPFPSLSSDTYRDCKLAAAREQQIIKMRRYFDSDDPILRRVATEWAANNPGLL